MVATRSCTSAAGIKLPPVHGAQKGVDPDLKPESQAKSKKVLLKPKIQTPVKSPVQTPTIVRTPVSRLRTPGIVNSPPVIPGSLLNTLLGQIPQWLYKPQLDPGEYHTLYLSKPLLDILLAISLA